MCDLRSVMRRARPVNVGTRHTERHGHAHFRRQNTTHMTALPGSAAGLAWHQGFMTGGNDPSARSLHCITAAPIPVPSGRCNYSAMSSFSIRHCCWTRLSTFVSSREYSRYLQPAKTRVPPAAPGCRVHTTTHASSLRPWVIATWPRFHARTTLTCRVYHALIRCMVPCQAIGMESLTP